MFRNPPAMTTASKSTEDIAKMRVAGRLASEVLDFIGPHIKAGMTTDEVDRLCHEYMVDVQQTIPAPLNYAPPGYSPYPKSICTSVNHVVCHGVPGERKLKNGDIVNLDITVIKEGFHGDTSRMFCVGTPSVQARRLCELTYECMWRGIAMVRPGARLVMLVMQFRPMPRATDSALCANFAVTALAANFTRSHRSCTTDGLVLVGCWNPA